MGGFNPVEKFESNWDHFPGVKIKSRFETTTCAMVKSCVFIGDGRAPPFNRNPYNGYINPYYWVDDHPLLYGNNGSLDPGTPNVMGGWFLAGIHEREKYEGEKSYRSIWPPDGSEVKLNKSLQSSRNPINS